MTFYISMLTRKQISISFKVPLMLLFLLVKPKSCTNSTICIENLYIIQALDQYSSIQLVPFLQTWHDVVCVDPFIPILKRKELWLAPNQTIGFVLLGILLGSITITTTGYLGITTQQGLLKNQSFSTRFNMYCTHVLFFLSIFQTLFLACQ